MSLNKELWISEIQNQLFASNEFLKYSVDHSAYIDNITVHIPQSGVGGTVTINPTGGSFPLTGTKRTDTSLDYSIDKYSTSLTWIEDFDEQFISYSKFPAVLDPCL